VKSKPGVSERVRIAAAAYTTAPVTAVGRAREYDIASVPPEHAPLAPTVLADLLLPTAAGVSAPE
jgi:hypothetical protein